MKEWSLNKFSEGRQSIAKYLLCNNILPSKGTWSDVLGIVSATLSKNSLNDKREATPAKQK